MFRVCVDITMSDLKDQLDQINSRLKHDDIRRMVSVEYHCMSID